MKKSYLIANWKANPATHAEAKSLALSVARALPKKMRSTVVLAVPFPFFSTVAETIRRSPIMLSGQDMTDAVGGPHTGRVTAPMIKESGASQVILGHSEVRAELGDTDAAINAKIQRALEYRLTPIICLGETRRGDLKRIVTQQFAKCFWGVSLAQIKKCLLVYEPVWAISKGNLAHFAATPDIIQKAHQYLRKLLVSKYGSKIAESTPILYGGSLRPDNAKEIFAQLDVDGGLVGAASLDAKKFVALAKLLG